MKERLSFRDEEVLAYLEYLIIGNEASDDEMKLYQNWSSDGFISEINYNTYISLKMKMRRLWRRK